MKATFCGHAQIENSEKVRDLLRSAVRNLIEEGCTEFLLGGYGAFDRMAASVLREMKKEYPQIVSVLVLPYPDHRDDFSQYDDTLYPPLENVPKRFAIVHRNRWMTDNADVLIAYVEHDWGGAAKTRSYAQKHGTRIVDLV